MLLLFAIEIQDHSLGTERERERGFKLHESPLVFPQTPPEYQTL